MLSVIGSLIGFASSTVPAITDLFAAKAERSHDLEKMKMMAHLNKMNQNFDLKSFEIQASSKEHERLVQHDIAIAKNTGWISALQRSVRPVITYAFFLLFCTIEITLLWNAINTGTSFAEAINLLWDEETKAIFAAVISFWFGSRAIEKARR
jgi:hypothetical protein